MKVFVSVLVLNSPFINVKCRLGRDFGMARSKETTISRHIYTYSITVDFPWSNFLLLCKIAPVSELVKGESVLMLKFTCYECQKEFLGQGSPPLFLPRQSIQTKNTDRGKCSSQYELTQHLRLGNCSSD